MRTIKPLSLTLALIAAVGISAQDAAKQPAQEPSAKVETCTVQGTVVAAATGSLLKSAWVTLSVPLKDPTTYSLEQLSKGPSFKEITDANGHFVINGIPAGKYEFHAGKSGYVSQDYRADGGPPQATLELKPGEKLNKVLFRLAKAAVIIGRITDEAGEPVTGVEIDALAAGMRVTESWDLTNPGRLAVTNDLGEYRLYDLPPGGYYLVATDSGFTDFMSTLKMDPMRGRRHRNHPTIYYPGVTRGSEAQKVRVKGGEETHIDFSLRTEKFLIVSGQVRGPDGEPTEARVALGPRNLSPVAAMNDEAEISTDAQGNFVFKEVLPGSYVVSAFIYGTPGAGEEYWAGQSVEADGGDVSGLILELRQPLKISGRVIATPGSKVNFQGGRIWLDTDGRSHLVGAWPEKDGTFTIDKVMPATLFLSVPALPPGWYVRSAFFGKQNVLEDGLNLVGVDTGASLEITLSPGAAQIEGVVLNGDTPVLGAIVRLFSERSKQHQRTQFNIQGTETASQRTDQDGHFVIKDIAPGKYRVLAFANENDDEGSPPSAGDSIDLAEKESKTLQFKLPKKQE